MNIQALIEFKDDVDFDLSTVVIAYKLNGFFGQAITWECAEQYILDYEKMSDYYTWSQLTSIRPSNWRWFMTFKARSALKLRRKYGAGIISYQDVLTAVTKFQDSLPQKFEEVTSYLVEVEMKRKFEELVYIRRHYKEEADYYVRKSLKKIICRVNHQYGTCVHM